ncbi:hypothetical protein [Paractinoplanes durhamensis]|uniref:Uncharacterized protein n=1 Tax=Paractinoplanes durhamensis TaxID=113563 RepID=A0ABQ3Z5W1_9ACTN|nr:hypothetical protein [Actinoplanes durhamensis]GIE05214.1 hypothetical protein Adu01nite_65640 [Actinoplanes durhamensis]
MRKVSSKAPRRAAALFVASAAVLLVAACGGGSSDDSSNSGNGNGNGNTAFAAYQECLAKNGVTITMPSRGARNGASGGPGEGGFPGGGPSGNPSAMPRPSGSGGPGGGGFPGGGMGGFQKPDNVDDATWQKAQEACASVRPSFGAGRNGGGGNGRNAAYQNCLKEHGVTASAGDLDTSDATVKKAIETCKVLQPQASATPTA